MGKEAKRTGDTGVLSFLQVWEQHGKEICWTSGGTCISHLGSLLLNMRRPSQRPAVSVLAERRLYMAWKRRRCLDLTALINVSEWIDEKNTLGET